MSPFNHKGHEGHKGKIKDKLRAFDFYHDLYIRYYRKLIWDADTCTCARCKCERRKTQIFSFHISEISVHLRPDIDFDLLPIKSIANRHLAG